LHDPDSFFVFSCLLLSILIESSFMNIGTEEPSLSGRLAPSDTFMGRFAMSSTTPEPAAEFVSLLEQVYSGSSDALGCLLNRYRPALLHWLQRHRTDHLRGKFGDSNVAQGALIAAVERWLTFRGQSEPELLAWIQEILKNHYFNLVRSFQTSKRAAAREVPLKVNGAGKAATPLTDPVDPPAALIHQEERESVARLLQSLPEGERAILRLRFYEHLSYPEIAQRLGSTAEAVRKQLTRLLHRLGHRLPLQPS
jgi:RNA polymerase sigma-70 factor (ECF subfamily)